ncbi:Dipeptidyl peptidase family member 6 [Toxocara canis]|uniref:Dipeptidyl peptidase family member 6 n=1 Tax=Toxocara canis TaxID=6265 RepID=A0A0B2W4H2_TOXCA|nr:Dipeptidyl peptidase family member 6 [Toxocara canis]
MDNGEQVLLVICMLSACIYAELIPRDQLFSDPDYSEVTLSPDGQTIAFLSSDARRIRSVYVRCTTRNSNRQVTFDNNDINSIEWTAVPNVIVYYQDNDGDENDRLYKLNITESFPPNKPVPISDRIGVKAFVIGNNRRDPRLLVAINDDDPQFHNIYEFDLLTDKLSLVFRNDRFSETIADNDLNIRFASEEADDGSLIYYRLSETANPKNITTAASNWVEYVTVSPQDRPTTQPVDFTADNKRIYWLWGEGSDLGRLVIHDFGHPERNEILYSAEKAEIENDEDDEYLLIHPTDKTALSLYEFFHKPELHILNETVRDDFEYLMNLRPGDLPIVVDYNEDFDIWLVRYLCDQSPNEYFLYHRKQRKADFLFSERPQLRHRKLYRMVGFNFAARDNFTLQAYLSLPPDAELRKVSNSSDEASIQFAEMGLLPAVPQKMVLHVHGGPHYRDKFGFSTMIAWLTNRRYAVLQVNYRGSTGFGKKYANAGNGEWGRKMHYDLIDAVNFAIDYGIADPSKIAIMGASYGGYAALVGMTFTPEVFACGVDSCGPSNLITFLETIPPYWKGGYRELVTWLGADKDTAEGRAFLRSRSPLFFANSVKKPLLILQGANDARVKENESDQFVKELVKLKIPVTYVLYPDEGHGFGRPRNTLAEAGFVERFLYKCLHGRYERFSLGQYNSSAIVIHDGENAEEWLSLSDSLSSIHSSFSPSSKIELPL